MIAKKLLEIQKSVRALQKDAKAYNYNYISGDKLLYFVRPRMDELGLVLLPEVLAVEARDMTYQQWDKAAKSMVEKKEVLYILSMRMTWMDTEDGETLALEWKAAGMNAFDKGYGSALTYGERYYLLKLFHIATDEDDVDAVSAEREKAADAGDRKRGGKEASPAAAAEDDAPGYVPTLKEAIADISSAQSAAELTERWNRWKGLYGKEPALIRAVAENMHNPKRKGAAPDGA